MVSLRFPFLFSQPTKHPHQKPHGSFSAAAKAAGSVAAAVGIGIGVGLAISDKKITNKRDPILQNPFDFFLSHYKSNWSSPMWGSLSLADNTTETVTESKTGVYANDSDIKNLLSEKYGKLSVSELKEKKELHEDVMEKDICMTVRLQIVYGRLSIRSVRNAFEESVGSRLQKFGGADTTELLQRFTSQFKDEYKLPRGSVIDLSKERGHVLRTTIDGKEVGSIQSKLLCRSILDLYIGEDSFDTQAKEDVKLNLAALLKK
ncbi:Chalcone isomerase [Macleaya cordata]|uniref:Chalcone isomerase n=1 Tax=Macleaya cordata TaxID=56857 RepID=A0A200QQ50_MACCD|nr:Chalcone isomerase [Macleaya cordata]